MAAEYFTEQRASAGAALLLPCLLVNHNILILALRFWDRKDVICIQVHVVLTEMSLSLKSSRYEISSLCKYKPAELSMQTPKISL